MPRIQWLGSGFGQRGSTSNCGASTPAAATAARFSRTAETMPSPARSTRKAATRRNLCFTVFLHFPVRRVAGSRLRHAHPRFQNSLLLTTKDCLWVGKRRGFYTTCLFVWRKTIFGGSRRPADIYLDAPANLIPVLGARRNEFVR